MKHITFSILFLISTNIAAAEIFLKCNYEKREGWTKFTADKNKDIGSMSESKFNGYFLSKKCTIQDYSTVTDLAKFLG